jgi:2-methylcitrate dehydratase PrpD
MPGLTETLSRFISESADSVMLAPAVAIAQSGFADTVATMIAGRDEPVVRIAREFVRNKQSTLAEASVVGADHRAASADAALINATAGHALDYDDVALSGHPSTVLVPAILAEGEYLGASGRDAVRAYLVGYEVWAELHDREPDAYHTKGWHPTAVLGTVAAAAAVASLHRLSPRECANALSLASSMASGVVANFGTMTKPLHAGRAASSAIEAVRLTLLGLTAAPDALEHDVGYLAAFSPKGRARRQRTVSQLGKDLRILESGLSIKKYPLCYATHRVIDGVLALADEHDIAPQDVKKVQAHIGVIQDTMLRNRRPSTGLEAKFSLEFAVASALVARRVGIAELTDGFVSEAAVQETMRKVERRIVDTVCPIEPAFSLHDHVDILLHDGRTLSSGDIRFPHGNAMNPLNEMELKAKFMDCVAGGNLPRAEGLYSELMQLATLDRMPRVP